jgi:hypothetical protein
MLALLFAAFALALLWQHLRPWWIGVGPNEPLVSVVWNGKFGYVSSRGVEALPATFVWANSFDAHGWALVYDRTGTLRWIDRHGRTMLIAPGLSADPFDEFDWARVEGQGRYMFIDRQGRNVLGNKDWSFVNSFGPNGLAAARAGADELFGYIDRTGNWAIPPRFKQASKFDGKGLAGIRFHDHSAWQMIDRTGNVLSPRDLEPAVGEQLLEMDAFRRGADKLWRLRGTKDSADGWVEALPFNSAGQAWVMPTGNSQTWRQIDRQGVVHRVSSWSGAMHRDGEALLGRKLHPLSKLPFLRGWFDDFRLAKRLGLLAPGSGNDPMLIVLFDEDGRIVWRNDFHILRPLLLPGVGLLAVLALLCGWRWRVAKPISRNPPKEVGVRTLSP